MRNDIFSTGFSLFCREYVICPLWDFYLTNSATLVFTTFEISKHPTLPWCFLLNVLEPSNQNFKRLEYSNIRRNLPKNNLRFTPWLVHLHIKRWLGQYFSQLSWSRIHLNVEVNKLHWLKLFDMTSTVFSLYFNTFDR